MGVKYCNCGCNPCSCKKGNRGLMTGNAAAGQIIVPVPGVPGEPGESGEDGDTYVAELTDNFFDI